MGALLLRRDVERCDGSGWRSARQGGGRPAGGRRRRRASGSSAAAVGALATGRAAL
ncbi:hypothetical protein ACP70R_003332 [Stipagrostis hirtigluma subsp. patula]